MNEDQRPLFVQRINGFEQAFTTLINGDQTQGILVPEDIKIKVTLEKSFKFWRKIRPMLQDCAAGIPVDLSAMQSVYIRRSSRQVYCQSDRVLQIRTAGAMLVAPVVLCAGHAILAVL